MLSEHKSAVADRGQLVAVRLAVASRHARTNGGNGFERADLGGLGGRRVHDGFS